MSEERLGTVADSGSEREAIRRGLLVGAGYFSDFHLDAWRRLGGVEIVCVCDLEEAKAERVAAKYGIASFSAHLQTALGREDIDFVDIATPPTGRLELLRQVFERGLPVICQKPLANEYATATQILKMVSTAPQAFMVHENFRFQPWYREIKRLLAEGIIGQSLHAISMRTRMGDGWGEDAYLNRQPYFRHMPRLLIHETGVHFVDTFRFLAGEIVECSAQLRRLNPVIAGEDAAWISLRFASGATAIWDANRYNESLAEDPRYTFGELLVECDGGSLWLDSKGRLTIKRLGQSPYVHPYQPPTTGFGGDCVLACQQHFLQVLDRSVICETSAAEYAKTLRVVEALYESAKSNRPVEINSYQPETAPSVPVVATSGERAARAKRPRSRLIDLSLPITPQMPGVVIRPSKSLEADGWNATTLQLYSHAGTHMDAPKHFLPAGATLDDQDLSVCYGVARVVQLAPAKPRQLHSIEDILAAIGEVHPGDRLLLRTDWHRRYGTAEYREQLPRISIELAHWLVEKEVALIGVEPPSVADVNNLKELTEVHQTLFRGGVVIVEGLANLDQLTQAEVEFIALPLRIVGGDGCPVRAIALEVT